MTREGVQGCHVGESLGLKEERKAVQSASLYGERKKTNARVSLRLGDDFAAAVNFFKTWHLPTNATSIFPFLS